MDENLFDMTLLLGRDLALKTIDSSSVSLVMIINNNKSVFFKNLTSVLTETLKLTDYANLSNQLGLSKYFLELIIYNHENRGYCNVCSRYFFNVSNHLKCVHSLSIDQIAMHSSLFSRFDNIFMPNDYKKQENYDNIILHPQEKLFKKSKIKSTPVKANVSKNISMIYEVPTTIVCKECGKEIPSEKKYNHSRIHQRNQVVECPNCSKEMRRRYFPDHYRQCCIE